MTDKPDVAALVARLRRGELSYQSDSGPVYKGPRLMDTEAADALEAQASELTRLAGHASSETARADFWTGKAGEVGARLATANATIERLRAVLEPFAESAAYFDVFGIYGGVPVRHLRDARDALKPDTGEKP